jgi:hypothetical protein
MNNHSKTFVKVFLVAIIVCNQMQAMRSRNIANHICKTRLQNIKNIPPCIKRNIWINNEPSNHILEKTFDATAGVIGGLVGLPVGAFFGIVLGVGLAIPYELAKINRSAVDDGIIIGAISGAAALSYMAGGPIGSAAFGTVIAGSYIAGKYEESKKYE